MAVHNRSLGTSEQKKAIPIMRDIEVTNGETGVLAYIPFSCNLLALQLSALTQASTPNLLLTIQRFIPGTGITAITLGSTFTLPSFGTSGVPASGVSIPAAGSTLNMMMPNDVLLYLAGGGATILIDGLAGSLIVQPTQDLRTYLAGLS